MDELVVPTADHRRWGVLHSLFVSTDYERRVLQVRLPGLQNPATPQDALRPSFQHRTPKYTPARSNCK
jgi:hypothetical protein